MFNAYRAVDFPAQRGIILRLYVPTFWGGLLRRRILWKVRIGDNSEGPFKVVDATNFVTLIPDQEYEIRGNFVLYSNDERPEGAKFTVTFTYDPTTETMRSSLFDNETYERQGWTYWKNGNSQRIIQDPPQE